MYFSQGTLDNSPYAMFKTLSPSRFEPNTPGSVLYSIGGPFCYTRSVAQSVNIFIVAFTIFNIPQILCAFCVAGKLVLS